MSRNPVLVDSSIWIDHLKRADPRLVGLLRAKRVVMHPMVIGEIAMGSLKARTRTLSELKELPRVPTAAHSEVSAMVEWLELFSCGIGFIDAHLLASARTLEACTLFTRDNNLLSQAERLEVAYRP